MHALILQPDVDLAALHHQLNYTWRPKKTLFPGLLSTTLGQDVYKPLEGPDSIRILILHPGLPCDPLSGSLQRVFLFDLEHKSGSFNETSYEALSYVWGKPVLQQIYLSHWRQTL